MATQQDKQKQKQQDEQRDYARQKPGQQKNPGNPSR